MKQVYFILILIIAPLISGAQRSAKNVSLDLSGPGGFISAQYDVRLSKADKGLGVRAGIGTIFDQTNVGLTLPAGVNYLIGNGKNFLELGAGVSYFHFRKNNQDSWFDFTKENFLLGYGWIGYRYQPPEKGFSFHADLCQFSKGLSIPAILGVPSLYPAFSFGYSFR